MRRAVAGLRADPSTPDRRASDDPQRFNPVATTALLNLTIGANDPGSVGNILHSRVRYFDPVRRRAGLAKDVAALVEKIGAGELTLVLVKTNPVHAREMIVQAGAYAEHEFDSVAAGDRRIEVGGPHFRLRLKPGGGERLRIRMRRYVRQPTLAFPW